jgi:hypothetical protein
VKQVDGRTTVSWTKNEKWRDWAAASEGCYLLRTNVTKWTAEEFWQAYIQLTEAEASFRIHKSVLRVRPVRHQKEDRVEAHVLACFLAYVLWKMPHQTAQAACLGDEPRHILDKLGEISFVDLVLPTRKDPDIRHRCVRRPTEHQAILLDRLGFTLPRQVKSRELKRNCGEDFLTSVPKNTGLHANRWRTGASLAGKIAFSFEGRSAGRRLLYRAQSNRTMPSEDQ